jgi:hypothetical protein
MNIAMKYPRHYYEYCYEKSWVFYEIQNEISGGYYEIS